MSRSKPHWRQPPASDNFAELESTRGYGYRSREEQSLPLSFDETGQNSKSKMARKPLATTNSRRDSTPDAEFEEDDEWNGGSDEDSKKRGRKKPETADKLTVSDSQDEF